MDRFTALRQALTKQSQLPGDTGTGAAQVYDQYQAISNKSVVSKVSPGV